MKLHFVIALAILIQYAGAQCIDTWFNPNNSSSPNITLCSSCSGSCYVGNPCSCGGGSYDDCLPDVNVQCNINDLTFCCPAGLYYNNSLSCCTNTPICLSPCATDETCIAGACECNTTQYQDLTLSNFQPTVICEDNTMTVKMKGCELEALGYDSSTSHLRDSSVNCSFPFKNTVDDKKVISLQAQATPNWCGNRLTYDDSNIYISNSLYIGVLDTEIIRLNNISFNFTCVYKRNMVTSLKLPGNITQQTVFLSGVNGTGSYPVTMAAYKNPSFTIPYENNDVVTVGSIIYVGMFVTGADGSQYVLRIESCVASPTNDRSDVNAFDLIKNGCPLGTVSTTVLEMTNALEAAFSISSFQFQNQASVYLFCDVRLCENATEACSKCGSSSKSFSTATNEIKIGLNIADNFYFTDSAGKSTAASWALLAGIQLAIVFTKFF